MKYVNINTDYDVIERTCKMLRLKANRREYANMGRGGIVMFAKLLGNVINGQRTILGFKPSLHGWHNTVESKLVKKRYETSNMTNAVIKTLDLPKWVVFIVELVISAVIYSSTRSQQCVQPGIELDEATKSAANEIDNL